MLSGQHCLLQRRGQIAAYGNIRHCHADPHDVVRVCVDDEYDDAVTVFIQLVEHPFLVWWRGNLELTHHFTRRCSSALRSTSARKATGHKPHGT